jgi:uridine phosphorylase
MRNLIFKYNAGDLKSLAMSAADLPVLSAAGMLDHRQRSGTAPGFPPPHGVILCFQQDLISNIKKRYRLKKAGGFYGDFYLLKTTQGEIAVASSFGIGAPAAVVLLEDLAAFGVQHFISIGLAGGLQEGQRPGDLVVPDRALRGEGTSSYYLEPTLFASPSPQIQQGLRHRLEDMNLAYQVGPTWTTDAPYREMRSQVQDYQRQGILAVDMEAAALFAAGQCLEIQIGAAFSIADTLRGLQWQPSPDPKPSMDGLVSLFEAALQVLLQE